MKKKSSPSNHPSNGDPARQRRQHTVGLANEFGSNAKELIECLSDWDFEIDPQVPTKDWSAAHLEGDAKREAEISHRHVVTEIAQTCLKVIDALQKHVARFPHETDPIIAESAHWPAAISIHPALDAAQAYAPIKKKLGSSLGYQMKRLKKRTIWQPIVEFIMADIEKHLNDAEEFRAAGLPWLLDFTDSDFAKASCQTG